MAYSSLPIALSLDEAARILSLEPAHFHQSTAGDLAHTFCSLECEDIWVEEAWQSPNGLSRANLARNIAQATVEVERFLGKPIIPRAQRKLFRIRAGTEAGLSPFGGVNIFLGDHVQNYVPYVPVFLTMASMPQSEIIFNDDDLDGFDESVTVTVTVDTEVSADAVVFYIHERFGKTSAEIRPAREIEVVAGEDEGTWVITGTFEPWQLIDPRLFLLPQRSKEYVALDLRDSSIYIGEIDVGYMKPDPSGPTVRFIYDDGPVLCGNPNCIPCSEQVVAGVYRSANETIWAYPATYIEQEGEWVPAVQDNCTCLRWPVFAEVVYYRSYSPPTPRSEMAEELKEPIALLAGARMKVSVCECDCGAGKWFHDLMVDLAATRPDVGRYTTQQRLNSVFGTLRGEQQAFDRLSALSQNMLVVGYGSH